MVENRPPISKAKMMAITKSALKGIKFYKHIVMNVEKFISKVRRKKHILKFRCCSSINRCSVNRNTKSLVYMLLIPLSDNLDINMESIEMFMDRDLQKILLQHYIWWRNVHQMIR
jgi:hypothetical protein